MKDYNNYMDSVIPDESLEAKILVNAATARHRTAVFYGRATIAAVCVLALIAVGFLTIPNTTTVPESNVIDPPIGAPIAPCWYGNECDDVDCERCIAPPEFARCIYYDAYPWEMGRGVTCDVEGCPACDVPMLSPGMIPPCWPGNECDDADCMFCSEQPPIDAQAHRR